MNIQKTIATLEITEDNEVILRERVALLDDLGAEKFHGFEQRTFKAGDDYSQECDKVKAVCDGLFGLYPAESEESEETEGTEEIERSEDEKDLEREE